MFGTSGIGVFEKLLLYRAAFSRLCPFCPAEKQSGALIKASQFQRMPIRIFVGELTVRTGVRPIEYLELKIFSTAAKTE